MATEFDDAFQRTFGEHFPSLFRLLDRRSGDPALAADVAQEAFTRLYSRGSMPDDPPAWLVTVAFNLLRSNHARTRRRRELLSARPALSVLGDPPAGADALTEREEERQQVRAALDRLEPRERDLLLLREEGFTYREIAEIVDVAETSVGTLLRRARESFRRSFEEETHVASHG